MKTTQKKQYNDRGWAIVNNVLNGTELKQLYSAIADAKNTKTHKYRYSQKGELIISTGRKSETLDHIVFVSGTYINPVITKIYEYTGPEETEVYKGNLFEEVEIYEELGLDNAIEIVSRYAEDEYFTAFTRRDFETYSEKRRTRVRTRGNISNGSKNTENGRNERGRSTEDTGTVTKFQPFGGKNNTDNRFSLQIGSETEDTVKRLQDENAAPKRRTTLSSR